MTRDMVLCARAGACIEAGKSKWTFRLRHGKREKIKYFYDPNVKILKSAFVMNSGAGGIGRSLHIEGPRRAGMIVGEYVGDVKRRALLVTNRYGVEVDEGVLDCAKFAAKPICLASMCNDFHGVSHYETHEPARENCLIVTFDEYPGRVFIMTKRCVCDEEGFVNYGKDSGFFTGEIIVPVQRKRGRSARRQR
jgi:hypothetical protein